MKDLKGVATAVRAGATRSRSGQGPPRAAPILKGQGKPEPIPLDGLGSFLERWTQRARERFLRDGYAKPFALAVSPGGETTWLSCGELRSKGEADAFKEAVDRAFAEASAVRGVIIAEVWLGGANAPLPKPGERCQVALLVTAIDAEAEMATLSLIEEDWELGAPMLRPAEKLDASLAPLVADTRPLPGRFPNARSR